jgi:murein DD-endopeptidase MepM/ murein hydrolase activator NlpD
MPPFRDPRAIALPLFLALTSLLFIMRPAPAFSSEVRHVQLLPVSSGSEVTAKPFWAEPLKHTIAISKQFLRPNSDWGAGHRGVDFLVSTSDSILAPHTGTISLASEVFGVPTVVLSHQDGSSEVFQPLCLGPKLKLGQKIQIGERLGMHCLGSKQSHCDALTCVHWAYRLEPGVYINPLRMTGRLSHAFLLPSTQFQS